MREWLNNYLIHYIGQLTLTVLQSIQQAVGCSIILMYRDETGKMCHLFRAGAKHEDAHELTNRLRDTVATYLDEKAETEGSDVNYIAFEETDTEFRDRKSPEEPDGLRNRLL